MIWLVGSASAKVSCDGLSLVGTVPSSGIDVPVDVRLAGIFAGDCHGYSSISLMLTDADGVGLARVEEDEDVVAETGLLTLAYDLDPDTTYQLGDTWSIVTFTTGSGAVVGLDGVPTLDTVEAVRGESSSAPPVSMTVTATPANDPDDLSILQLRDGADSSITSVRVTSSVVIASLSVEEASEVCPQIRQLDGTGAATEWSEPVCVPVTGAGCSSAGANAGVLAVLVALAGVGKRRSALAL
jgi:hypothetical protein